MLNMKNHARSFVPFENNTLLLSTMAGLLLLVIASVIILAFVPPVSRDGPVAVAAKSPCRNRGST